MSRFFELRDQLAALDVQIEEARLREFGPAVSQVRELIELYGMTPQDVGFVRTQVLAPHKVAKGERTFQPRKVNTSRFPPLYRDLNSGKTWNGRGPAPRWLDGYRDEYLIRDAS